MDKLQSKNVLNFANMLFNSALSIITLIISHLSPAGLFRSNNADLLAFPQTLKTCFHFGTCQLAILCRWNVQPKNPQNSLHLFKTLIKCHIYLYSWVVLVPTLCIYNPHPTSFLILISLYWFYSPKVLLTFQHKIWLKLVTFIAYFCFTLEYKLHEAATFVYFGHWYILSV